MSVIFWTLVFSLTTAASIALLGTRSLISGDLFRLDNFLKLIFNWRFILSMILALTARFSFILINNSLLKIPPLAQNSTTITAFATTISFVFIIIANYFFLNEKINLTQGIGAFVILIGIFLITWK